MFHYKWFCVNSYSVHTSALPLSTFSALITNGRGYPSVSPPLPTLLGEKYRLLNVKTAAAALRVTDIKVHNIICFNTQLGSTT